MHGSSYVYVLSANAQNDHEKGLGFITNYLSKNYNALPQTWSNGRRQ